MAWKLAVVCLVVIPLFRTFSVRLGRQRRGIARSRQRRSAGITGLVEESLSVAGVLLAKTLGRQDELTRRFAAESRERSETEMQSAMSGKWIMSTRRATRGRTTIALAHPLPTVRHADQIVVLDRGRAVERGPHAELLRLGGRYARLAGELVQ